ncbi:MAG: amidohydrolase family protein [Desulfobacteraceae bacterium]|nr:amidohydrolase family protein [Desulfobacteraceae bacterium]
MPSSFMNADGEQRVRVGWLIDGLGGPAQKDMVLVIRADRIASIEPWHPAQSMALDFSNATVLPPLMDAHVHLVFSGSVDPNVRSAQLEQSSVQAQAVIIKHLEQHWRYGVAAVRDGGDRDGAVLRCKQHKFLSAVAPVHVAATCWAWHVKGRYGKIVGRALPDNVSPAQALSLRREGIDHVKLMQSGINSIDRFGEQSRPQFGREELQALVAWAHDQMLPVMVHANGEAAVRLAVEAGCDSIEHGYFMGHDNLKRMADHGTVWVPTVMPMEAFAQAPGLTAAQRDVAHRTLEHQVDQISKAHQWGVTIALGTDAGGLGVDHGVSAWQELKLLMAAGLPLEVAIHCATANVANLMRLNRSGELLPGQVADFIVIPGSPGEALLELPQIQAMYLKGQRQNASTNL